MFTGTRHKVDIKETEGQSVNWIYLLQWRLLMNTALYLLVL
jgi:hypothetical protein